MRREEFIKKFGREPRCDADQLAMLERCSDQEDISEWNTWRVVNPYKEIWLEGANLGKSYLKGAYLGNAHLEGANLVDADLEGANLWEAHLEGADLESAHLEGADLRDAHLEGAILEYTHLEGAILLSASLEGADFSKAIVNGNTLISDCTIDNKTNFTAVGLDSVRIQPSLLAALKTNIRRIAWNEWYEEQKSERIKHAPSLVVEEETEEKSISDDPLLFVMFFLIFLPTFSIIALPVYKIANFIKSIYQYGVTVLFMKLFWWISDYGSSTKKILKAFLLAVLLFASSYAYWEINYPDVLSSIVSPIQPDNWLSFWAWLASWLAWFLQIVFFASATMVTLGFANINVAVSANAFYPSLLCMGLVAINLLTGYFLLAVLVTRIGILFQSMGPEQEITRPQK